MKIKAMTHVLAGCALAVLVPVAAAQAGVTYTYTGATFLGAHDPFTTSDNVTGTVTFNTPLGANLNLANVLADVSSFSFTAGPETLTNLTANAAWTQFQISTDASGNITGWHIYAGLGGGGDFTLTNNWLGSSGDQVTVGAYFQGDANFDPSEAFALNHIAATFAPAATAAVPEPASWALMLGGFGLVGGALRSRRKVPVRFA